MKKERTKKVTKRRHHGRRQQQQKKKKKLTQSIKDGDPKNKRAERDSVEHGSYAGRENSDQQI